MTAPHPSPKSAPPPHPHRRRLSPRGSARIAVLLIGVCVVAVGVVGYVVLNALTPASTPGTTTTTTHQSCSNPPTGSHCALSGGAAPIPPGDPAR